jgi:hypothetical protein
LKTIRLLLLAISLCLPALPATRCLAKGDEKTAAKTEKGSENKKTEKQEKADPKTKQPANRYGPALDGKGHTTMFGVEGKGYKFVYVIDRSGSTGGDGNATLKAAKTELLASIKQLESTHAFQIVFYNERPATFDPKGNGQTVYANDKNKEAAEKFLDSISASGGTEHEAALKAALKIKPDVIFWLTDADRPKLDDEQIDRLTRLSAGTIIHTIEFGQGPQNEKDKNNFLQKIADGSAGEHLYLDVKKMKADEEEKEKQKEKAKEKKK